MEPGGNRVPKKPRILLYDIEVTPLLAWIWRPGHKIFVGHDQIKQGSHINILCIAYKWFGSKTTHVLHWDLATQDSSKMIADFTKIIESADLAIGHNADQFDMKHINTARLLASQPPIAWPTTEDTLKQFRRTFAFPSYKLDYLARTLTGAGKDKMCFQDWIDIVEGKSATALRKMLKYCKRDVNALEAVFKRAMPFLPPKIHVAKTLGAYPGCPRCGDIRTIGAGYVMRITGRYRRLQCLACGHKFRLTTREKD